VALDFQFKEVVIVEVSMAANLNSLVPKVTNGGPGGTTLFVVAFAPSMRSTRKGSFGFWDSVGNPT